MEILKLISANEFIAQVICFLIVFFLLRALMWEKFLKILEDRRQRIKGELDKVEQTKQEVALLRADFEGKLKNIDEIAAGRMKEAVKHGEEVAEEMKDRARLEAQRIVSEAKSDIEQTVIRTKEELQRQVVEMTLLATEKLISEKLTGDADRKLVKSFIDQMEPKS